MSRKSAISVSQFTTVQEGSQLEGALADKKSPLLSITEGVIENAEGNPDNKMVPYDESRGREMSISETEVVGPDGTVYAQKVSVRSIKKVSINEANHIQVVKNLKTTSDQARPVHRE